MAGTTVIVPKVAGYVAYDPTAIAITGGSITGTNVPYIPTSGAGGIPFIHISSGSIAANGAISAITALPLAYPNAYCYFPANAVATSIAAGWYYCTFSTTTAGVAFLDTYTSGTPTIPASPTAVTTGTGAYTGVITEVTGPNYSLATNVLGVKGTMSRILSTQYNNTAGNKVVKVLLGGSTLLTLTRTTTLSSNVTLEVQNQGRTDKQLVSAFEITGSNAATGIASTLFGLDSTTAMAVALNLSKAVATDNMILERYRDEIRVPT